MSNLLAQEQQLFAALAAQWQVEGRPVSVSTLLPRAARLHAAALALRGSQRSITYQQWWFEVLRCAQLLKARGVLPGQRIVIFAQNSPEFYVAYFAIWHLGAVAVPLNVYLHEREIALILDDAQPALLLTTIIMQPLLQRAVAMSVSACPVIVLDEVLWQENYTAAACKAYEDQLPGTLIAADELAVLLYTSGTTGVPKGVMLSSANVMTNALQVLTRFTQVVGASKQDRFLALLPLFHVFAQNTCIWLPVMLGAEVVIVSRIERRLILEGLEARPTMFFGFPALYGLLVLMKTAPLESVRLFVSGADALPDKIRAAFGMVYGRKICSGYGLTEAAPVIAADGINEDKPTNVVGRSLVGIECQVRNDEGDELEDGMVGTLWVRGGNVMMGYYNDPQQTARVLVNGWLNTGDLACMTPQGELAISGRSKDLIINKGFNIYPQEIENVLLRHPAVIKAAVVGKDEESQGEVPVAYIALRDGYKVQEEELAAFCKENLAAYKVPRVITQLSDLPMTPTGKIDKKQLRSLQ